MDAPVAAPAEPTTLPAVPISPERRAVVLFDALRHAADGGEHRLFRGGKLPGLFPARSGATAEVALAALADGLLETVRTEVRGKVVTEWVRATPKGVRRLHDTDSPQSVVRELAAAVAATRSELADHGARFARQTAELAARFDALTARLEATQRRADMSVLTERTAWADSALRYLDCRPGIPCPLAELFRAVGDDHPDLTLAEFHTGLIRLTETRALRLTADGPPCDPEYAVLVGAVACHAAIR